MELDKNAINKLLSSNDKQLWSFIQMAAGSAGINLPSQISAEEMAALRQTILGAAGSGISTEDAMAYLKNMGIDLSGEGK
ncbi:MAG: hypothetical protein IKM09_05370 [Clostridia bacterium]|nr:hypothetical protein [Clostridia bacterium]